MLISYFVDISKGYFPNLCVLAKRFSLVRFMGSSPWGLHSLVKGKLIYDWAYVISEQDFGI